MFPVFARARENARRSACQSNLKQLGLAFIQYSQDNDEQLPLGTISGGVQYGIGWAGDIHPYVKNANIYMCPSDTSQLGGGGGSIRVNYAYNRSLVFVNGTSYPGPLGKMAAFNSPSKTVMLNEVRNAWAVVWPIQGVNYSGDLETYSPSLNGVWNPQNNSLGKPVEYVTGSLGGRARNAGSYIAPEADARHLEGSNFLLADGHVKWYKGSSVSSGFNAPTAQSNQGGGDDRAPALAAGTENTRFAVTYSAY